MGKAVSAGDKADAVTQVLRICCQVPEITQPNARLRHGQLNGDTPTGATGSVATIRSLMTPRSNHRTGVLAGLGLLLMTLAPASQALDGVVLEVRELSVAGITVHDASARLDLPGGERVRVTLKAGDAALPEPAGKFTDLQLVCTRPVIAEPRFGCEEGRFTARGGPTGSLDMSVVALLRSDTGITTFSGKGLKLAGTTASFDGQLDDKGWRVKAVTGQALVSELRKFAAPWFALPKDITGDGKVAIEGTLADAGTGLSADVTAKLSAVDLTNEASTIVTDKMSAVARLQAEPRGNDTYLTVKLLGTAGQVLVNPMLLDFGVNPTDLEARGTLRGDLFALESLHLQQKDLLDVTGSGTREPRRRNTFAQRRVQAGEGRIPGGVLELRGDHPRGQRARRRQDLR